jgi:hypothetical protein
MARLQAAKVEVLESTISILRRPRIVIGHTGSATHVKVDMQSSTVNERRKKTVFELGNQISLVGEQNNKNLKPIPTNGVM